MNIEKIDIGPDFVFDYYYGGKAKPHPDMLGIQKRHMFKVAYNMALKKCKASFTAMSMSQNTPKGSMNLYICFDYKNRPTVKSDKLIRFVLEALESIIDTSKIENIYYGDNLQTDDGYSFTTGICVKLEEIFTDIKEDIVPVVNKIYTNIEPDIIPKKKRGRPKKSNITEDTNNTDIDTDNIQGSTK